VSNDTITYVVGGGCALIGLTAFCTLILVPALTAYRRPLERIAALVLSVYVLAALVGVGILLGALVILEWPRVF